ncbi:alpha/beta fold hydrolase [Peristeroidobacter soli]|uniref:alpha/beta fold hydrolase n=1 Tax=Peristeroidobacter soli TaxID=2497877 RepID=UPI00101C8CD7|nr:alpha/beta fold hydrolase [Peristeroidobacter soli]
MFRCGSALACLAVLAMHAPACAADEPALRHGYVDMPYGQLHYSTVAPPGGGDKNKPDLVLFHQSPNSSVEYNELVQALGKDRVVIALDTPGHGGSDGPKEIPRIEDYAAAMRVALKNLGYGPQRQIDVFGFHTGSRIVAEIAATEPGMVRRVMMGLSGVSVVPPEEMKKLLDNVHHPESSEEAFTLFCERLPKRIKSREKSRVDDTVWGRMAVEELRPLTRYEYGHAAAFEYSQRFDARLAQLTQPVALIVIEDGSKESGLFKFSAREMSEKVVGMLKSSKQAKVLPDNFVLRDLHNNPGPIADAMRRYQDERI